MRTGDRWEEGVGRGITNTKDTNYLTHIHILSSGSQGRGREKLYTGDADASGSHM